MLSELPCPEVIETDPPVLLVVEPPATVISPAPVVPSPTCMLISPPFPPVALPDETASLPEAPDPEVPVANFMKPLTPLVPEFGERITTTPLVEVPDIPDKTVSVPPVTKDGPAVKDTYPPIPVLP